MTGRRRVGSGRFVTPWAGAGKAAGRPKVGSLTVCARGTCGQRKSFPSPGRIRFELGWKALAEEHGKGCDPNAIGRDFVRYCSEAGIPLGSKGVKDEFVRFCRKVCDGNAGGRLARAPKQERECP